ncbi:acyl carrier protein [Streptomyces sp. NPDC048111]|uniref:acyl carrier protein n=1 Tax=Streptomyces sp. NPDC048111 TaxID=3365500 RepID=UPI003713BD33
MALEGLVWVQRPALVAVPQIDWSAMGMPVFTEVRTLISETLRIPADHLTPDTRLTDLDSLARAELAVALENSYAGKVDGDRAARAATVKELVTLLEKGLSR